MKNLILSLALVIGSYGLANAQGKSGIVRDSMGSGVPNASVTIINKATGKTVTKQTNENGNFAAPDLPDGEYLFKINADGFSALTKNVKNENGAFEKTDFILEIGSVSAEVTVTATRRQVATLDTAVPVTVVGEAEIERKNVSTVGDIFRDLPGMTTVNEGAFQVRPTIRGLDSNRILILVDGERLNNARTSTGNSGIEPGLVDIAQIETLEVVRGGGSVLYGTDALAGTVNIITKDAPRNLEDGFRFGAILNGFYSSNENGRRGSLAITGSSKRFSFRAAQSLERYENYFTGDTDGLVFSVNAGFPTPREVGNSQSHGSATHLTTRFFLSDDTDLRVNYERRRVRDIGSPLLTPEFGFNGFFPVSGRDKFSGRFETRNISDYLAKIAGTFYVQDQQRNFSNRLLVPPALPFFPGLDNFSETITDTGSVGFDVQTNWLLGSRNFLTAGASYFRDENKDFRLIESRIPVLTREIAPSVPNSEFGSFAGFAQNEFALSDRIRFIGGIRIERFFSSSTPTDKFALPATLSASDREDLGILGLDTGLEVGETTVTGDFGTVFKLTDEVRLTGRIGRSYRVPNLFERFFTGAGSVGGFVVGNPALEPETGINYDTSIKVNTGEFAGSFTYFNNYYENFLSTQTALNGNGVPIVLPPTAPRRPPTRVSQTINIGRARIQGFEAELEIPFQIGGGFLTPNGNISYLRGDDLETGEPLDTITPLKTVLNLRWNDVKRNYYADWTTRIINQQDRLSPAFLRANGGAEAGYAASDIGGGYTFTRERFRLSVNTGIKNVFNRFYAEQFVFAPARGRSFVVGTTLEIR